MSAKLKDSAQPWVDPDDAPELTDEFFSDGAWQVDGNEVGAAEGKTAMTVAVRRGRPKANVVRERITIRLEASVLQQFKATGPGWQTRMNAALADWLKTHTPTDMTSK